MPQPEGSLAIIFSESKTLENKSLYYYWPYIYDKAYESITNRFLLSYDIGKEAFDGVFKHNNLLNEKFSLSSKNRTELETLSLRPQHLIKI